MHACRGRFNCGWLRAITERGPTEAKIVAEPVVVPSPYRPFGPTLIMAHKMIGILDAYSFPLHAHEAPPNIVRVGGPYGF